MKSIKRKFDEIQFKHPGWSSYICFGQTITGAGFSKKSIEYWFNKLVEKDDYRQSEKKGIIEHLLNLSKVPVQGVKPPRICPWNA